MFYFSIFPDSRITQVTRYGTAGQDRHGGTPGAVLSVGFELGGRPFTALNGGPQFTFTEAVSFQVPCRDQAEIDRYWNALLEGGGTPSQCGWLKDKFGLSWQVFPDTLLEWTGEQKTPAQHRTMLAMMSMSKLDLAALRKAYEG